MYNIIRTLPALLLLAMVFACSPEGEVQHDHGAAGINIADTTECALDGMILANYPGPKAQIHYRGGKETDFFCETKEMFYVYLEPGRKAEITGLFVQETAGIKWEKPEDNWLPAKDLIYVVGSSLKGSMGPTFAPFKQRADADAFVKEYGGEIKNFDEIIKEIK